MIAPPSHSKSPATQKYMKSTSQLLKQAAVSSTVTKQENSLGRPTKDTSIYQSSTFMMLSQCSLSHSKAEKKVNYFDHTERYTPISTHVVSNQNSTSWTTRHPLTLKISSHPNGPSTSTPHLIFTAPTQQRRASRPTKAISKQG